MLIAAKGGLSLPSTLFQNNCNGLQKPYRNDEKGSLILAAVSVQIRAESLAGFQLQSIQPHLEYIKTINAGRQHEATSFIPSLGRLQPFLRALLVADGTVTLLLRAYFDEPIVVATTAQSGWVAETALPHLGLLVGDNAFFRQVDLIGGSSRHTYAQATSVLNPAALPPALFAALIKEDVGMGEVLRNSSRGSYREILDIRVVDEERIARTYTVTLDKRPAIIITEVFNSRWF